MGFVVTVLLNITREQKVKMFLQLLLYPLSLVVKLCHAVLCFQRRGEVGAFPSTPHPPPPQSSCAVLKHKPGAACTKWPTHSGTDVNAQISVCLASLQASTEIHCKITLKHSSGEKSRSVEQQRLALAFNPRVLIIVRLLWSSNILYIL